MNLNQRTIAVLGGLLLGMPCMGLRPAGAQAQPEFHLKPRQTIVLFGDSITAAGDYGQIIQNALDLKYPKWRLKVLSRGSHGDTARGSWRRIQSDIVVENPDWVAIKFGTNDVGQRSPEEFEGDLTGLVERLRKQTKARIILVSPVYPDHDKIDARFEAYLPIYSRVAAKYGALYAPVYETMARMRPLLPGGVKYAPDGAHPNAIGHEIIGQTMLQSLGYTIPTSLRFVDLPATQTSLSRSTKRVGTRFTLPLPRPVSFHLTEWKAPTAVSLPAKKPIVLDGKLEEWDRTHAVPLGKPEQRSWGVIRHGVPHVSAQLNAAYDAEALYFAIEVKDDTVFSPANPPRIIDRDWVELCLDLRDYKERAEKPDMTLNAKNKRAAQLIVSAPDEAPAALLMGNGDPALLEGATVAGLRTKTGYNLEIRIPHRGLQPAVGFDWGVVDIAPGRYYLGATSFRWTGSVASSFSTREFGVLQFLSSIRFGPGHPAYGPYFGKL